MEEPRGNSTIRRMLLCCEGEVVAEILQQSGGGEQDVDTNEWLHFGSILRIQGLHYLSGNMNKTHNKVVEQ